MRELSVCQALSFKMFAFGLTFALLATQVAAAQLPPDIVVAADGSGDFISIESALETLSEGGAERRIIEIRPGTYTERVILKTNCLTLRGTDRERVKIEFKLPRESVRPQDQARIAVVNIMADDVVLENLTINNSVEEIGPHAFAVFGRGTRTIIQNATCTSRGADTVSLWQTNGGMYYHANCEFAGSVDFLCPRGWCFVRDCSFYEYKRGSAAIWHDGDDDSDKKFVLKNCSFDGVEGFKLGRRHREGHFYLLDCKFTAAMADSPIWRVTYPDEPWRNQPNLWGDRYYYHHCLRQAEAQFPWYADNLAEAPGSPSPEEINAAWTFAGKWDPERTDPPRLEKLEKSANSYRLTFSERVTVHGTPSLSCAGNDVASYASGSGGTVLLFDVSSEGEPDRLELEEAHIFSSLATRGLREVADQSLPAWNNSK